MCRQLKEKKGLMLKISDASQHVWCSQSSQLLRRNVCLLFVCRVSLPCLTYRCIKVSFRFLSRCFRTFSGYYISLLYHHRVPNNISTEERRGEVLMVFWYGASIFHSSFVSLSICNANSHCNWFFDKKAHVLSVTDKLCDGNKSERGKKRENKQIQNKSERTARIFTAALEVEPEEWKVLPGYTYPIVPIHMCVCDEAIRLHTTKSIFKRRKMKL